MADPDIEIKFKVEPKSQDRVLRALRKQGEAMDSVVRNLDLGKLIQRRIRARFSGDKFPNLYNKSPDGEKWKPITLDALLSRVRRQGTSAETTPPLYDTGSLRDSLRVRKRSFNIIDGRLTSYAVSVSEEQEGKAVLHNAGGFTATGGQVPARPFMGLGSKDIDAIVDAIRREGKKKGLDLK